MGTQVFFRYILNDSLIWAEEFSSYMLVLISFFLLGAAFQRGEMMKIELLMVRLPDRLRAAVNVPIYLVMIAFLLVLSYYCYRFALLNRTTSIPAFDFIVSSMTGETRTVVVSRFWLYLTLPLGMCILAVHLAVAMSRDFAVAAGWMQPTQHHPPAEAGS
jgi:TRAP-type C4-dicarboxylate transport system permease small subunit